MSMDREAPYLFTNYNDIMVQNHVMRKNYPQQYIPILDKWMNQLFLTHIRGRTVIATGTFYQISSSSVKLGEWNRTERKFPPIFFPHSKRLQSYPPTLRSFLFLTYLCLHIYLDPRLPSPLWHENISRPQISAAAHTLAFDPISLSLPMRTQMIIFDKLIFQNFSAPSMCVCDRVAVW